MQVNKHVKKSCTQRRQKEKKKKKNLKANTELSKCEYTKIIDVKGKKPNNFPTKKKKLWIIQVNIKANISTQM